MLLQRIDFQWFAEVNFRRWEIHCRVSPEGEENSGILNGVIKKNAGTALWTMSAFVCGSFLINRVVSPLQLLILKH